MSSIDSEVAGENSDTMPIGPDLDAKPWFAPISDPLSRIAEYSERQREKNPPIWIEISPDAGLAGSTLTSVTLTGSHPRLRVIGVLFTSTTAATRLQFFIGGRYFFFNCPANDTKWVPLPIEIDRGIDLTVNKISVADSNWDFYLFAYTE